MTDVTVTPDNRPAIIERLERAELLLQRASDPQDFVDIRSMAESARIFAQQFKLSTSSINYATKVKLLAERGLADAIDAGQEQGTIATKGRPENVGGPDISSLEDLGVSRQQVSEARIIRDHYTPEAIDVLVDEANSEGKQLARSALVSSARAGRPHVSNNSGDNEWYTPEEYLVAARFVMGEIDLDPASSNAANAIVKAGQHFTVDLDGLAHDWRGRVWMNPPYAQPACAQFAEKLVTEYTTGNVTEACVLVNNATETAWFQGMAEQASAICFPKGRVRFWHPEKVSAPLQGQAILYLGPNSEAFNDAFSGFGFTVFRRVDD